MDKKQFEFLLKQGEGLQLEFKEDFGKKSISRNPLLFSLFKDADLVEKVGSGIGRMREAMKGAGLPLPVFEFTRFFTVIFKRPVEKTREKTREKIISLIKINPYVTTEELARETLVTIKGIEWQLKRLKDEKIIKRIGPDKGGSWEVKK